jgi:hypothetical protein
MKQTEFMMRNVVKPLKTIQVTIKMMTMKVKLILMRRRKLIIGYAELTKIMVKKGRAVLSDLLRESPGWIYSQRKEAEEHCQQFREDDQQSVIDPETLNEKTAACLRHHHISEW